MALVAGGYNLSFTFRDQQSNTSSVVYETTVVDELTAETLRDDFIAAYNAVGSAQIVSANIVKALVENAPANPVGAEVQEKASLTLQLFNTPDKANLNLVSPLDAIFTNNGVGIAGNEVNTSFPALLTFTELWENGRVGGNLLISDGQAIVSGGGGLLVGRRVFRSRRRR